ncbi:hypothetical protein AVEN_104594-1 [Araneus ventricosus]|uniref:Coiled-coil domain-containing protein 73 n=1 Tax=Araneus ventricosus TaxID=182803 RepID=A0A4Y2BBQ7_ARAVE|nr:hypothetical protein AVEN_104594-1 [Araneus ventricosus]
MDINAHKNKETSKNNFDALSFERKLIEMVEELRLRRNLEAENEKALKSLMDEKHRTEIAWDENQRRHSREKSELEQQISVLNRKLEDRHCGLDDEKTKQQLVNKTYSEEIKLLKEELRKANSEKLTFAKRIQELEGQLNLKNSFQESIMDQIAEIKKRSKSVGEECQELSTTQTKMLENVSEMKIYLRNIEIRIEHVQEVTAISEKKNGELKNELVSAKSEITMLRNSALPVKQKTEQNPDLRKFNEKYSELEKLFALSQKENEKMLNNFLESNRLLCEAMDKYADAQETEKILNAKIETYENEILLLKRKEEDLENELAKNKGENDFTKANRIVDTECKETQTLNDIPTGSCSENTNIVDLLENENFKPSVSDKPTKTELSSNKTHDNTASETTLTLQVLNKFTSFKENGTAIFGAVMKRKLSLMDDDESEGQPKKLFCSANVIDTKSVWEIENQVHRLFRPLIEDEKSIPSSFNSLDDIGLSQEKQENEEFNKSVNVDTMREDNNGIQIDEVQTIDVTSVQMNLKELKVCDSGATPNKGQNDSCIQGKEE